MCTFFLNQYLNKNLYFIESKINIAISSNLILVKRSLYSYLILMGTLKLNSADFFCTFGQYKKLEEKKN